jgi:S1-C subfamily serine protease
MPGSYHGRKAYPSMADPKPSGSPGDPPATPDDAGYLRPPGVSGSFGTRASEPLYRPPPATVSPEERATYGRTPGDSAPFAPLPGERIPPAHRPPAVPVDQQTARSFGPAPGAGTDGFDAPLGSRIWPTLHKSQSPWWKPDAERDPWRDPASAFWLGRPAIFVEGDLHQLDPDADTEGGTGEDVGEEEAKPSEEPRSSGRGRLGLSALLLTVIAALLAGTVGGGAGWWLAQRSNDVLTNGGVSLGTAGTPANRPPGSVADVAQRVSPAVVSIDVHGSGVNGTGSGFLIQRTNNRTYVLTNNHVVSAAATAGTIRVTYSDRSSEPAKIVGRDPLTDLAVLAVTKSDVTIASLGDSAQVAVGDPVIAIGSPLGLRGTVTTGIVSALDRPVHLSGEGSDTDAVIDAIQTDAAINPGNSGGALVDASGTVIGVNSAIASLGGSGESGNIGVGFAIPMNSARDIAQQLIRTGRAVHASAGLSARSVTDGSRDGAYVLQVSPDGPAAKAGLKGGDVITAVDNTLIESADELTVAVQAHKPGDAVKMHFFRGAQESDVSVTLASV